MHKKINILILFFLLINLSMPQVIAKGDKDLTIPVARDISEDGGMELIQDVQLDIDDPEIEPINTKKVKDTVVPNPNQEGKKVIGLFIKTMIITAFCVIIIYSVLVFIKKFYASAFISQDNEELENLDLSSPQNKQDALRSFLNRTK